MKNMQKGFVHIYTGDGKGKTTAAMGLAVRALGSGMRPLIVQFLKGQNTGELDSFTKLNIKVIRTEEVKKFIPYMTEEELEICKQSHRNCLNQLKECILSGEYNLIVLDEIIPAVSLHLIKEKELLEIIEICKGKFELILTGRDAPDYLIELADYVSEIKAVKHPYSKGITARKGIEF